MSISPTTKIKHFSAVQAKVQINPLTYQAIFSDPTKQQEVNQDAKDLCKQLNIDPENLKLREANYFKDGNDAAPIQEIRYKHYTSKRMKHLEELENLIFENQTSIINQSPRQGEARDFVKVPESMRSALQKSMNKP